MTENIAKISFILLILSGVFTFIAIMLINSSIRLAIYAKRFTIKTMQLVGATKSFIRKPFIYTNMFLGVLGALIANALIGVGLFYLNTKFPELHLLGDIKMLLLLFGIIILAGIIITVFSTYIASQRFLKLKTAELY
jgi:cell division transport system permease protein